MISFVVVGGGEGGSRILSNFESSETNGCLCCTSFKCTPNAYITRGETENLCVHFFIFASRGRTFGNPKRRQVLLLSERNVELQITHLLNHVATECPLVAGWGVDRSQEVAMATASVT